MENGIYRYSGERLLCGFDAIVSLEELVEARELKDLLNGCRGAYQFQIAALFANSHCYSPGVD
jgi:hypothetical protein